MSQNPENILGFPKIGIPEKLVWGSVLNLGFPKISVWESDKGFGMGSHTEPPLASAIQSSFHPPLETVYNLKLNNFVGTEGPEGAERWFNHVEKTYRVMKRQGNFPEDRWVETTT